MESNNYNYQQGYQQQKQEQYVPYQQQIYQQRAQQQKQVEVGFTKNVFILQQVEGYNGFQAEREFDPRKVEMGSILQGATKNPEIYIDEKERFNKDFAHSEKQERQRKRVKLEKRREFKRIHNLEREQLNYQQQLNQQDIEKRGMDIKRNIYLNGKKNCGGLPYNPINQQYHKSQAGKKLERRDDKALVRAFLRAENLDQRSNCGYDVITGEKRQGVRVPEKHQQQFYQGLEKIDQHYGMNLPPDYSDY